MIEMQLSQKAERFLLQVEEANDFHQALPDAVHIILNPANAEPSVFEEMKEFLHEAMDFKVSQAELFEWAGGVEGIFTDDVLILLHYRGGSFMIYTNLNQDHILNYPSTLQ